MPNSPFMVRHVRIAASLKSGYRPRLPVGGGPQITSGSNQTVSEPRRFNASLKADQFVFLYLVEFQLRMLSSAQAGFTRWIP